MVSAGMNGDDHPPHNSLLIDRSSSPEPSWVVATSPHDPPTESQRQGGPEKLSHSGDASFSRSGSTPRSRQAAVSNLRLSSALQDGPREDSSRGPKFVRSGSLDLRKQPILRAESPAILPGLLARNHSVRARVSRTASNLKAAKRKRGLTKKSVKGVVLLVMFVLTFFLVDWWFLSRLQDPPTFEDGSSKLPKIKEGEGSRFPKGGRPFGIMYDRLLGLASHALAEGETKPEPKDLWEEPYADASAWRPCAEKMGKDYDSPGRLKVSTGHVMVSANGGLNQQRVAVCNAVAVAHLLNATLVLPRFLYSSVWKDNSQFGDIYQEQYFIDYLKDDVTIVKELPVELQSLNLEAIGSLVSDMDVMKESKPSFYVTYILPILLRNRVVHFHGFSNRLSFDPIPFELQRLRCRCNFHALKFVPKIQKTGALLIKRMKELGDRWGPAKEEILLQDDATSIKRKHLAANLTHLHMLVDTENLGTLSESSFRETKMPTGRTVKYLGLHLRFEMDMAAYSMCEFGGGETERQELEAYREIHFPTLTTHKKSGKLLSAATLREEGKCPLTPEEAVLMLVALGFKRGTRIFLAGAHVYGGQSRMVALTTLYPNLVTKEDLLSSDELASFMNNSSQLAALDFIGCAAADVFAMTDSGSQLSSLVSGYRIYYGGGLLPTIRPNKRRLASIFSKNMTIEWDEFRDRLRKSVKESKRIQVRPIARSIYRHPRCLECMCKNDAPKKQGTTRFL